MEVQEASLADKMGKAFDLSLALWRLDEARGYDVLKRDEEADLVYGWADGLVHKHYQDMSTGRCSLLAMVKFDIEKFEESVDRDIEKMNKMLVRVRQPVIN
jgi:hypothetical protein